MDEKTVSVKPLSHHLFAQTHVVRGRAIHIIPPEGMPSLEGKKVRVHSHSHATEDLGERVYSVIHSGNVIGHAKEIELENARLRVDMAKLQRARQTGSKTANTFVEGIVAPRSSGEFDPLHVRSGEMKDPRTGENLAEGVKRVRLDNFGAGYVR